MRGKDYETHLSAQQPSPSENTRVSGAHVNTGRASGIAPSPSQGAQAPHGFSSQEVTIHVRPAHDGLLQWKPPTSRSLLE